MERKEIGQRGRDTGGRGKEKNVGEKRGREVQGHGRRGRERCRKGEKRGSFLTHYDQKLCYSPQSIPTCMIIGYSPTGHSDISLYYTLGAAEQSDWSICTT